MASLLVQCLEELGDIFGDNLARFGNVFGKNECSRDFKFLACHINRKGDFPEPLAKL